MQSWRLVASDFGLVPQSTKQADAAYSGILCHCRWMRGLLVCQATTSAARQHNVVGQQGRKVSGQIMKVG